MVDLLAHDRSHPDAIALVDAARGETWSYRRLDDALARIRERLAGEKAMALVLVRRDVPSLVAYLGALGSGHAVLPIDADLDTSLLDGLVETYAPELILFGADSAEAARALELDGYGGSEALHDDIAMLRRKTDHPLPIHPDLSLLLSTSGSTGSPKLVRLSAANVVANGDAIRQALRIDETERAITSLAFSYSFGLSIVHSHLLAGASLVVSGRSIMLRDFWNDLATHRATSFSGVPYTYELIRRVGFEKMELPSLRTLTQAGGKLGADLIRHYHGIMDARGGSFVVMYGQTEATARISVLPPELLPEKLGGVGFPLPGGRVEVRRLDGEGTVGTGEAGELIYHGPNVMMGYAETREDLGKGDLLGGTLVTGDSGYLDEDGCIFITGRLKRFAKVMGLRVSLDEVEGKLQHAGAVAALDGGDQVVVCTVPGSEETVRPALYDLAGRMRIHPRSFDIRVVDRFPLLSNGKIDYRTLGTMVDA